MLDVIMMVPMMLADAAAAAPEAVQQMQESINLDPAAFEAIAKGAKDFIIKPFDPQRVLISIDRLFT